MASIQALCLKFVFSILLVMVLLKVSPITEAASTQDVSNFESQSFEEPEYANFDTSNFAVRGVEEAAAPAKQPNKYVTKGKAYASKAGTKMGKVYDKYLKKWVDKVVTAKKGTATKPAATPAA